MPFFIIFVVIPLLEIMVFMSIGEHVGMWNTLLLAFSTAILGGIIIKYQGLHTIRTLQEALKEGMMPVNEIFDGVCLITAGAALITPGFVTDTLGFLLLVPSVRVILREFIKRRMEFYYAMDSRVHNTKRYTDPEIINIEYEEIDGNPPEST